MLASSGKIITRAPASIHPAKFSAHGSAEPRPHEAEQGHCPSFIVPETEAYHQKATCTAGEGPRWTPSVTSASAVSSSDKSDGGPGCFQRTLIVNIEARGRDSVRGDLQSESQSWGTSGIAFPHLLT